MTTTTGRECHTYLSPLEGARCGDAEAWGVLRARFDGLLRAVARRQGLAPHDCDDVVQSTWCRFLQHIDVLRDDRALPGWLVTTCTREAYAVGRRSRREVVREVLPDDSRLPATDEVETLIARLDDAVLREQFHAALAALPDRERRLVEVLISPRDLSYREISARLGMPVGAIGPIRQRAIRRLRALLVCDGADLAA